MNKLLDIFFRYIISRKYRMRRYLEDVEIIDDRYPHYLGMPAEMYLFKNKLKEDSRKYWRIFS